jgi:hypothetical protein
MIPVPEFLRLSSPALDLKVVREWQYESDPMFVEYVLQHRAELNYQHLRCALRILQNVNRADVRELFKHYSTHSEIGYRSLAQGSLEEQQKRGWCSQPVEIH